MDEFAQTRAPDDLFDDDFTPVAETVVQTFDIAQTTFIDSPDSRRLQAQGAAPCSPRTPQRLPHMQATFSKQPSPPPLTDPNTKPAPSTEPPSIADTTPASLSRPPKPSHPAVRGDRLATGGTPKPKLTEDELSARLAAAKLNNAKRAEAHRLAEADEASFHQREAKATQRRQEESKARRVMDMEREKNRLRKLEAGKKGGREWDDGKEEEPGDRRNGVGSGYRRGANGAVMSAGFGNGRRGRGELFDGGAVNGHRYNDEEQIDGDRRSGYVSRGQGRGRGQGDRGRGRGRGRGGSNTSRAEEQPPPDPLADFPALPIGTKDSQIEMMPPDKVDEALKTVSTVKGESWADQVNARDV